MAAAILGSFYRQRTLYEYQSVYNAATDKFEVQPTDSGSGALYITGNSFEEDLSAGDFTFRDAMLDAQDDSHSERIGIP